MIDTAVEGGQKWLHKMRMFRQIIAKSTLFSLAVSFIFLGFVLFKVHPDAYRSVWYNTKASVAEFFGERSIKVDPGFWKRANKNSSENSNLHSIKNVRKITAPVKARFGSYITEQLKYMMLVFFGSKVAILIFFTFVGRDTKKKKVLSGGKVVSKWKKRIKLQSSSRASPIKIGGIPMIKGTESRHIIISGGTGTGKTNCMRSILKQIREQKQPAIIVDTTGEFVEKYYREGKDIILNPYDERSADWHPWIECEQDYDFDSLSQSLIPPSNHDAEDFWRRSATTVLSATLKKLKNKKMTSDLVEWILTKNLKELCHFLEGTKAASVIDASSEKTAASVRSVCSSFLSCLDSLKDTEKPFSIKKWTEEEKDDSWLFLHCKPEQRVNVRPLLSCWFSIATNNLLRKNTSLDRRVWFVVDELRSLQKLPDLETFCVEARKYGGCGMFSIQSPSQLVDIYGRSKTETILGNCQTKIVFSESEPKTANLISEFFGEIEVEEAQKGISFGANDVRDGVSISQTLRKKPLVSASQILGLETNEAFLKLPGTQEVSKIKFKWCDN